MAYGFDADRLLVWIAPREPDSEPMHAGSLCLRHADAMVVPRGWTLDDRRESSPRLFRPAPRDPSGARSSRPLRAVTPDDGRQLPLPTDAASDPSPTPAPTTGAATVAAVAGPSEDVDPDATVAIPWLPEVDDDDDLGGVLSADSPLLARAFRGADRPRGT